MKTFSKRKAVCDMLTNYCVFAKEQDYIEVTEWTNGDGYDIDLNGKKHISLTHGEVEAISYLTKSLDVECDG